MNFIKKSVLFCWELGGGLGHIAKAVLLAEELLDAGCEVTFAFRDLADVHALLPMDDYRVVQSPVWSRLGAGLSEPSTYPELLLHFGFGSPIGMMGLCRAWRSLLTGFEVDLVIADHAPNAILAARTLGLPVVTFGNGFFVPPLSEPVPPYRGEASKNTLASESLALRSVNQCLAEFDRPPLNRLADLFDIQRHLLCTVPELDHYAQRPPGRLGEIEHVGPVYVDRVGERFVWPESGRTGTKRIFAYLYAHMEGIESLLAALAGSDADVAVYCAGLPAEVVSAHASKKMQFLRGMVNLRAMVDDADLFVCGGTDTAYCAVFNGVPLLGVPVTMEQRLTCERIAAQDAGRWAAPGTARDDWAMALASLLRDARFSDGARRLADRYRGVTPDTAIARSAEACLALLGTL